MKLVLSEIASRIRATAARGGRSLAIEAQRQFALFASSYGKPLGNETAIDGLDQWSDEFKQDPAFLARILANLLSAMENEQDRNGLSRTADLTAYRRVVEAMVNSASLNPAAMSALSAINFNRKVFNYATIDGQDKQQMIAAASAFKARDQLLTLLVEHDPENYGYLAHRGVSRFWMGIAAVRSKKGDRSEAVATVLDLVGQRTKNLHDAITDLKKARQSGDRDFETLYRLADAQRWLPSQETRDGTKVMAEIQEALPNYAELAEAIRDDKWVAWPKAADVLSQYAAVYRASSTAATTLDLDQGDWQAGDANAKARSRDLTLDSLYAASRADSIARQARNTKGGGYWNTNPEDNLQYIFSIALLANRLIYEKQPRFPDVCDLAASHPYDPLRQAPAVQFETFKDELRFKAAKDACDEALKKSPDNARTIFLLGRVLSSSKDKSELSRGSELLGNAAARGYATAFNNLSFVDEQNQAQIHPNIFATRAEELLCNSVSISVTTAGQRNGPGRTELVRRTGGGCGSGRGPPGVSGCRIGPGREKTALAYRQPAGHGCRSTGSPSRGGPDHPFDRYRKENS